MTTTAPPDLRKRRSPTALTAGPLKYMQLNKQSEPRRQIVKLDAAETALRGLDRIRRLEQFYLTVGQGADAA